MRKSQAPLTCENPTIRPMNQNQIDERRTVDGVSEKDEGRVIDGASDEECSVHPPGVMSEGEDEAEEGQAAKGVKKPTLPSQVVIAQHNLTHVPYRNWCPHCVKGKSHGKGHFRVKTVESELSNRRRGNQGEHHVWD